MKLTYEMSREDSVEAGARQFLRSRACAVHRWRGAAVCAAMFAVFAFLGFNAKQNVNLGLVCAAAGAWGAGLFLLTHKGSVRRRIRKYATNETPGAWPRPAACEVRDGTLVCFAAGARRTFAVADFCGVVEDAGYVELRFGARDTCVIPRHVFRSTEEKSAFLAAIIGPERNI